MKKFRIAVLGLIIPLCCSCVHGPNINKLEQIGHGEALAVGKINVMFDGKDVTEEHKYLYFRTITPSGSSKSSFYTIDESGFFFARLPIGASDFYAFEHIVSKLKYFKYLPVPGEIKFNLAEEGKIYYIGNFLIEWDSTDAKTKHITGNDMAASILVAGPLAIAIVEIIGAEKEGKLKFTVQDNDEDVVNAFAIKFDTKKDFTKSIIKLQKVNKAD